jgi:hypothetical protein
MQEVEACAGSRVRLCVFHYRAIERIKMEFGNGSLHQNARHGF